MTTLLIWGAGGFGRSILETVRAGLAQSFDELFFIDDGVPTGSDVNGAPVIGGRHVIDKFDPETAVICIGVGQPALRWKLTRYAMERGFRLATVVDSAAIVRQSATIEPGCVICAGAIVN